MIHKILLLILFLLLSTPASALTDWCDTLHGDVGCFLMEDSGNETDVSRGNTLTETDGTIPQDADKKFGTYSRDFELGDTEYLTHADGLDTDFYGADQHISIVHWTKFESSVSGITVSKADGGTDYNTSYLMLYLAPPTDTMWFCLSANLSSLECAKGGSSAYDDGSWHHVAGVYNDTDIRLYLDGVLDSNGADNPQARTDGFGNSSAPFRIGTRQYSGSLTNYFDGLIDDVGIFDVALDSTDINDIMDNGLVQAAAETILLGTVIPES